MCLIPLCIKAAHKTESAQVYSIWNKSTPQSKTAYCTHGGALTRLLCRLQWPLAQDLRRSLFIRLTFSICQKSYNTRYPQPVAGELCASNGT